MYGLCFARSLNSDVRKFLDGSFQVICFALAVASLLVSLQLLTIAHCDRFDGLLCFCLWLSGFCFIKFLCWNVCWLTGFWVFVLKTFLCATQTIVIICGAPACDLGGLVHPFLQPWELF